MCDRLIGLGSVFWWEARVVVVVVIVVQFAGAQVGCIFFLCHAHACFPCMISLLSLLILVLFNFLCARVLTTIGISMTRMSFLG
jgi:hypothetical protein